MASIPLERPEQHDTASVHKLPNELLGGIFLCGLAPNPDLQQEDLYLDTITSVCTIWREVAISNPLLWTDIRFNGLTSDFPSTAKSADSYPRPQRYLQRSKGALIRLLIYLDENEGTTNFLRATITPHLSRCISLRLEFLNVGAMKKFLPLCGPLQCLESASVVVDGGGYYLASKPTIPLFDEDNVSPLRELRLRGPASGFLKNIPTAQLSDLYLLGNQIQWLELHFLLPRCSAVKSLYLDRFLVGSPTTTPKITMPALESLVVEDTLSMEFCNVISMPCLQHLEIYEPDFYFLDDIDAESQPTSPSFMLKSLMISCFSRRCVSITVDSLRRVLAPQTSIHTVTLDRSDHAIIPLLQLLGSPKYEDADGNGPILPALELLKLSQMDGDDRKIWDRIGKVLDQRQNLTIVWEIGAAQCASNGGVFLDLAQKKHGDRLVVMSH